MNRPRFLYTIAFVILSHAVSAQQQFLRSQSSKLVNGNNTEIKLNGVNLGGWLLWEGWIWGGGFKSEKKMDAKLTALFGKDSAVLFKQQVHSNYITQKDIQQIASLGMNTVRVPFNHSLLESDENPFVYKSEGFAVIDSLLSWCRKYKVYAVLDLHGAPGGQNSFFISDPDKLTLWKDENARKRTVELWKAIAKRYAADTVIAAYDLLNEPKVNDAAKLVEMYKLITSAIREVDNNHILMYEGNNLARNFEGLDSGLDKNMILSFHYYTWFNENNKMRTLTPVVSVAQKSGVPLWCGEWGEDKLQNIAEIIQLLEKEDHGFCGHAFWTWKKVYLQNNKFPISEILVSANARQLLAYIAGNGKKPDKSVAINGWTEFITALSPDKTILNKSMSELLKN